MCWHREGKTKKHLNTCDSITVTFVCSSLCLFSFVFKAALSQLLRVKVQRASTTSLLKKLGWWEHKNIIRWFVNLTNPFFIQNRTLEASKVGDEETHYAFKKGWDSGMFTFLFPSNNGPQMSGNWNQFLEFWQGNVVPSMSDWGQSSSEFTMIMPHVGCSRTHQRRHEAVVL